MASSSSSSSSSKNTTVTQFRDMIRGGKLALHKLENYGANQKRMSIVPRGRGGGRLGNIQLGITPGAWKKNPQDTERITTKWGLDWYESKSGAPETNKQKLDVCMQLGSETMAMFEEFDAWVRSELVAQSIDGSQPFGKPLKLETVDVLKRGGLNVSDEYGEAHMPATVMVDKLKLDFWNPADRTLHKGMARTELVAGSMFLATIRPTLVWFGWEAGARDLKMKSWGVRWETDSIMAYHLPTQDDVPPFDLDEETIESIRECSSGGGSLPSAGKRKRDDEEKEENGGGDAKRLRTSHSAAPTEEEGATQAEEEAWASVYPMP